MICSLSLFAWVYHLIEFGRLKFIHEIYHIYSYSFRFTNYVCKWPSSVHDSFIFRESQLHDLLKNQKIGWLLGDSWYALQPFLMTPKSAPQTEAEITYNKAHSRTRIVVEKAFGVLKSRFRYILWKIWYNILVSRKVSKHAAVDLGERFVSLSCVTVKRKIWKFVLILRKCTGSNRKFCFRIS